jgi:UDP-N-acetylmuramoyl-tripeptide--D-alanyl-D-alanine ligase
VYFDVNEQDINDAIISYSPDNNRSQLIETGKNTLIMDAYNANPTSLEAALLNFAAMEKENKLVIIGKMMELGPTALEQHAKIGQLAVSSGFDKVFLIGENYQLSGVTGANQLFNSTDEAIEWFSQHPIVGSTILIKGSRANQLEKLQTLF